MELTKQQVIDKILSFNYIELAEWIKTRLQGRDKYFPLYLGREPNLSEFLLDAFQHIKDEKFRDNFIEILGDLARQLLSLDNRQIEESREYISELLFLCGNIKQFENKDTLLEIAVSGKFKGIEIDEDSDLHAELLTTLASYGIAGICEFWIEQLLDDSNKDYANPAFYALKDYPDKLFKHIVSFIDKFKGSVQLDLGIMSLINDYGRKETFKRFKGIAANLSMEQKEAINTALIKAGCNAVYRLEAPPQKKLRYIPSAPSFQYICQPTPQYGTIAPLKDRVGEVFKLMGFEVETNREIADHTIDLFIKKKKTFGDLYECWICFFDTGTGKVRKDMVDVFYPVREAVREELEKLPGVCDDCQALMISEKGFTKEAVKAVRVYGIQLKTYEGLLADLSTFYSHHKKLIQDIEITDE